MYSKKILNRHLYMRNFILVAIPAAFIIGVSIFLFMSIFNRYAEDYESLHMENILNQNISIFNRINNDVTRNINHLVSSDSVNTFFVNENIIDEVSNFQSFVNTFHSITQSNIISNTYIKDITVYSEANGYVCSTKSSDYLCNMESVSWLKEYQKGNREYRYVVILENGFRELVYFYPISMYGVTMGVIVIQFDYEQLIRMFDINTLEYFQVNDSNDMIIICNNIDYIGESSDTVADKLKHYKESKSYRLDSKENAYSVFIIANALYTHKVGVLSMQFYGVMFFSILFIIILVTFVTIKVYFPIRKISDMLFEQTDISQTDYPAKRKWEYEFIIGNIQNTLNNNRLLQEQLSNKLERLNKMHTVALQAQINPHFLYNTLQMIGLCAEEEIGSDENTVSNMVKLLSRLIEVNFSTKNHLSALKEELEHLSMYYRLQRELYGDTIYMEITVPKAFDNYIIPKITLQPILENAIQHGIKPSGRACKVTVSAELKGEQLCVYVQDNGVGMEDEVLDSLRESMNSDDLAQDVHIGLRNINQRIKLIFGQNYGIQVNSILGEGTQVEIFLPAKQMKDIMKESETSK